MIGYLRGKIRECSPGKLLLVLPAGPAESAGAVGYSISTPQSVAYHGLLPGEWVEFSIHTHVREDALDLYGFLTGLEKEIFLTLLGVSGIGPKGAMGILSGAEPGELVRAIAEEDKEFLTKLPGIGKKTAERVMVELAEPMRKRLTLDPALVKLGSTSANHKNVAGARSNLKGESGAMLEDAKSALLGLGYREAEITGLLNRALKDSETPPVRAEDLVRLALRQLV